MTRTSILGEIARERMAQRVKHGDQSHLPDGTGPRTRVLEPVNEVSDAAVLLARWAKDATDTAAKNGTVTFTDILLEEVFEALAESDPARLRAELIQVAAVTVQWIEALDARALAAAGAS